MNSALRSRTLVLGFALVAGVGTLVVANSAQAQDPGTGAAADKDCPGVAAELGQTITCNFTVVNTGDFPAQVTALTEQSPFPSGDMVDISCTAGGTVISEGGTLAPDVACNGTFQVTVGTDPAICNTNVLDRVGIELLYTTGFPQPLTAGAFATHVTLIVCPGTTPPTTPPPTTPPPPPPTTASRPRTPGHGRAHNDPHRTASNRNVVGSHDRCGGRHDGPRRRGTTAQPPPGVVAPRQRRSSERSESARRSDVGLSEVAEPTRNRWCWRQSLRETRPPRPPRRFRESAPSGSRRYRVEREVLGDRDRTGRDDRRVRRRSRCAHGTDNAQRAVAAVIASSNGTRSPCGRPW